MKLVPVVLAASLIVAAFVGVYLVYSSKGGNSGAPEGTSLLVTATGSNYSAYVGLVDSDGRFVSSSGNLNFTVSDARGHRLFSYARYVRGEEFKPYRIDHGGSSLRYSFNFSRSELKPGVPLQNGSGIAQVTFTQANGAAFTKSIASLAIQALPRISIGNVSISKVGSVGAFVTISWSPSNFTAYSSDFLTENVSLFFFNEGDEGVPILNVLGIDCVFSLNTTGFGLAGVLHPGTKINSSTVFLPSNARFQIVLVIRPPNQAYSGPFVIQISMEPAA